MAIINLKGRITNENSEYEENKCSEKSLVYISETPKHDNCSPEVLILTVGDSYYENSQKLAIGKNGIIIKPGHSKVIETKQKITTPLNVIGLISGIGTNIYSNGFVSPGKIDQGFNGKLKIAFFNAGKKNFVFKQDDVLANVMFFTTEETLSASLTEEGYEGTPAYQLTGLDRIKLFWSSNWVAIISLLIAVISLLFELLK